MIHIISILVGILAGFFMHDWFLPESSKNVAMNESESVAQSSNECVVTAEFVPDQKIIEKIVFKSVSNCETLSKTFSQAQIKTENKIDWYIGPTVSSSIQYLSQNGVKFESLDVGIGAGIGISDWWLFGGYAPRSERVTLGIGIKF